MSKRYRFFGLGAAILFFAGCDWLDFLDGYEEPVPIGVDEMRMACNPRIHENSPERARACAARGQRWVLTPNGYECLPPKPESPATEAECIRRGGNPDPYDIWEVDRAYRACSLPTSDAGKPCCSDDGCEGRCLVLPGVEPGEPGEGRCSRETLPPCISEFEEGIYLGDICH